MRESKLSERWQTIGGLSFFLVITFRVLWQIYPGLLFCILFWASSMLFGVLWVIDNKYLWSKMAKSVSKVGGILNAIVTIANGGYMPILSSESHSIWVQSTEAHKLMILADIYSGWSIGDFFILSGMALVFSGWVVRKTLGLPGKG